MGLYKNYTSTTTNSQPCQIASANSRPCKNYPPTSASSRPCQRTRNVEERHKLCGDAPKSSWGVPLQKTHKEFCLFSKSALGFVWHANIPILILVFPSLHQGDEH